jgi:hypothetical protein
MPYDLERRPLLGWVRTSIAGLALCACGGVAAVACSSSEPAPEVDAGNMPDGSTNADASTSEGGSEGGGAMDAGGPFADAGTVSIARQGGRPISPLAFGHNYWDWVDWANDGVTGVSGTEARVTALDLDVIRAGGANNDMNGPGPAVFDTSKIDAFVAYARAVGAEPILQVPVIASTDGGAATAQTAADMVTYANVIKGYAIKYWEIGNEPDLYATTYDAG